MTMSGSPSRFPVEIIGAGGGSDDKGHTPVEAPDSLRSISVARILDLLCEGPIEGVVGGPKGVYLDDVPLQKPDSEEFNFKISKIEFRNGSDTQEAITSIPSAESELAVGVEITKAIPVIRTITTAGLDAVRLTFEVPGLQHVETNGDINGTSVELQVEIQANGGSYELIDLAGNGVITGKTTSKYQRTIEIPLTGSAPWNIRVSRLTDDHSTVTYSDKTYWASYTEVQMEKLSYPGSALVGLEFDASQFQNVPSRSYLTRLLRVLVPTNYNPIDRTYSGTWDGTFKEAWTNNPAWCLYDLLTHETHGLGAYIDADQVDKWALYEIGQYCDESVNDGHGGTEPRFTCNVLLQRREDAWKVVQEMCSIFRGLAYWVTGTIQPVQDCPKDPEYLFTPSNVIEGKFSYSGTSRMSRHNAVLVAWNDPTDRYKQKTELVMLDEDVAERGLRQTEIVALGCTSQGQAHRVGRWLLYTELYETETITFRTGLEGATVRPGSIISVQDDYRLPSVGAGRVAATPTATDTITLDSSVTLAPGTTYTLQVFTGSENAPFETRTITTPAGTVSEVSVSVPFDTPPVDGAAYQILESTADPYLYRILSITEQAPNIFEITGMSYDPEKYTFVESDLNLQEPPGGNDLPSSVMSAPANLGITEYLYVSGEALKDRMHIYWDKVTNAASYFGQWRKDNGSWNDFTTSELAFDVLDVNPGLYEARVCGVSQSGQHGLFSRKSVTLVGKTAAPADVTGFKATGGETTVELIWDNVADLDLSHYVIREGASWSDGTEIWRGKGNAYTWQHAPTNGLVLWIKAEDTSGNQSTHAAQASLGGGTNPATDDYIYPMQKPKIIEEWARIQSEKLDLDAKAVSAGVSATAYDAAATSLSYYLNDVEPYNGNLIHRNTAPHEGESWEVAPGVAVYLGSGGGAYWRGKWQAYYGARDTLSNAIKDAAVNQNLITPDLKRSLKAEYDQLVGESTDLIARATECGLSSTAYATTITNLQAYMDSLTGANGWSGEDWSNYTGTYDLTSVSSTWQALVGTYSAVKTARNALRLAIEQVLTDRDWVAPAEKPTLKSRYDTVLAEQVTLDADADSAGVSRTDYDNAVTALVGMIGDSGTHPCFTNMDAPTYLGSGGRSTMEGYFKTIADEKKKLESAIETGRINALPQDTFRATKFWDWKEGDVAGWTSNGTLAAVGGDTTIVNVSGSGGIYVQITGLSGFSGKESYIVVVRLRVNSGTWDGRLQYTGTNSSSFQASEQDDITGPAAGVWKEIAWDLRYLDSGAWDYQNSAAITGYKIYLNTTGSCSIDIDWIACGTYGAGSKADYDNAVATAATTAMQKADWLSGGKIDGTKVADGSILTPALGANIIFAKNLVVANFDNLVPNPNSELAGVAGTPTGIDTVGCYNASGNAYSGDWVRKITCVAGTGYHIITPEIPCSPGEQFIGMAYAKIVSGTGAAAIGMRFLDKSGSVLGYATTSVTTTSSSYAQIKAIGTAPANSVSVDCFIQHSSGSGTDTSYYDALYFRRMADANLIVDGAIQANHITAGAIQTYHLSVGPLIEFVSRSSGGCVLKGYSDGSYGRDSAPAQGAENATDGRWYADASRLYPSTSGVTNVYEAFFGTTQPRGILFSLSSAFSPTSGFCVYQSGTSVTLFKVTAVGTYDSIKSVTVATAADGDKLSVAHYNDVQNGFRLRVYLNGVSILTATDSELTASGMNGARSGYAGLILENTTARVWGVRFGKGNVVIQDGVVSGDMFVSDLSVTNVVRSPNYVAGSAGNAPTGFKLSGSTFTSTLKDGTTLTANAEFGEGININGYKAAVLTNNAIGGYQEFTAEGTTTFSVPTGVTRLKGILVGAGGGGGGGNQYEHGGGGGGGAGGHVECWFDVPAGVTTLSITVPSYGTGGGVGSDGGDGQDAIIKTSPGLVYILRAQGGKGGKGCNASQTGDGGAGGGCTIYDASGNAFVVLPGYYGGAGQKGTSPVNGANGTTTPIVRAYPADVIMRGSPGGGGSSEGTSATYYGGEAGRLSDAGGDLGYGMSAFAFLSDSSTGSAGGGGGGGIIGVTLLAGGTGGSLGSPRYTLTGGVGVGYGCGGGGGGASTSASGSGGNGKQGFVRIEW